MAEYRLYYFDKGGHIFQAVELDCETDRLAIETAARHASSHGMELWLRNRRIRVFEAKSTPDGGAGSGKDAR